VRLLAIDDDPKNLDLIALTLEGRGLELYTTADPEEGLALFSQKQAEIVFVDLVMPGHNGMQVLERILEAAPDTNVVVMSAYYSTESAVEAVQKGACDYLDKPFSVEKLRSLVDRLVSEIEQRKQSARLEKELLHTSQFEGIVGSGPLMLEAFEQIRRVGPHFRTVLLHGATGTGKELMARALHRLSSSPTGAFVPVNCSAIVETLFESELFGHTKGAFTGATQDKMGVFEHANGGTVFLDEIGDMPLPMQAKILRVLQNREVQRVGSPAVRKVDVRVIAATHRDLAALVEEKQFREDLYYRLSTVVIEVPSLAQRKEDLPLLERHFLDKYARQYKKPIRAITRRAQVALASYSWPGNVRELENVLDHACMMAQGEAIDVRDLPPNVLAKKKLSLDGQQLVPLEENQRRYAVLVLERLHGNKAEAAKVLGISRATLYRLLAERKSVAGGSSGVALPVVGG
jgi:DNA-binding NtrC family response regulator